MRSPYAGLTARGLALRQASRLRSRDHIREQPPNSNCDRRKYGIRWLQDLCAGGGTWLRYQPWCGCFVFACHWRAKVPGISYRHASVALIEDDARNRTGPWRRWAGASEWRSVLRGDAVILFGRGVHVELVRGFRYIGGRVYVITEGGNTSGGPGGSQSNGGGAYKRVRPLSDVYGFAIASFRPRRGKVRAAIADTIDRTATFAPALPWGTRAEVESAVPETIGRGNDELLYDKLTVNGTSSTSGRFLAKTLDALGFGGDVNHSEPRDEAS